MRSSAEQPAPPEVRRAIRDVIRRSIYGVDRNPDAVELCKIGLWLESHEPGEPLGFLDHHVKCGDSVVGVARAEELLEGMPEGAFRRQSDDDSTAASTGKRNRAERASRGQIHLELEELTRDNLDSIRRGIHTVEGMAEHTLDEIEHKRVAYQNIVSRADWKRLRELASILTAQFFMPRTEASAKLLTTDAEYLRYLGGRSGAVYEQRADAACRIARERRFLHWSIEFPGVFERGGFDCILGNPPFLGGKRISIINGVHYTTYPKANNQQAENTCDLVGYFFRRAFGLIRSGGGLGLIATNTIAQGDTRTGSLEPIAKEGGEIVFAVRSMKWPGLAAVSISLLAIHKGAWSGHRVVDGREVPRITPYLDDADALGNPRRLHQSEGSSHQGQTVLGMGFVLEPSEALGLIDRDPRNRKVLFPYLVGEDLNSRPDQSPSRWVINFHEWPEQKARQYPECFRIIEEKVRPERDRIRDKYGRENWWRLFRHRPELYRAMEPLQRVLVIARHSKTMAFAFADPHWVMSEATVVFSLSTGSSFALLQSVLPRGAGLESAGWTYHEHRQAFMHDTRLGLTRTYDLFHSGHLPGLQAITEKSGAAISAEEAESRLQTLRDLHVAMDRAVLAAYEWSDLPLEHGFHEVDFLPDNNRVRFTVSPGARREPLQRPLKLNHRYHAEEEQEVLAAPQASRDGGAPSRARPVTSDRR